MLNTQRVYLPKDINDPIYQKIMQGTAVKTRAEIERDRAQRHSFRLGYSISLPIFLETQRGVDPVKTFNRYRDRYSLKFSHDINTYLEALKLDFEKVQNDHHAMSLSFYYSRIAANGVKGCFHETLELAKNRPLSDEAIERVVDYLIKVFVDRPVFADTQEALYALPLSPVTKTTTPAIEIRDALTTAMKSEKWTITFPGGETLGIKHASKGTEVGGVWLVRPESDLMGDTQPKGKRRWGSPHPDVVKLITQEKGNVFDLMKQMIEAGEKDAPET